LTTTGQYTMSRIRHWVHSRFKEPIAIIESDDWGLWRSPRDKSKIQQLGKPKIWAYDQLESKEEVERIIELFMKYRDRNNEYPKMIANFITSYPDFKSTIQSKYQKLFLKPLSSHPDSLKSAWTNGFEKKVFIPQYHGRLHFNAKRYLQDLQKCNRSRLIFEAGWNGGLNNLINADGKLKGEYMNLNDGEMLSSSETQAWISQGINEFKEVFHFHPKSIIAPQYILPPQIYPIIKQMGFTTIQGMNMQIFKKKNKVIKKNLPIGREVYTGLIALARNIKFEPTRHVTSWQVDMVLSNIDRLIKSNIPVIIDTHRINYVGDFKKEGLYQMNILLDQLANKFKVQFLTSFELAEAIKNNGKYTDFFSNQIRYLTPVKNNWLKKKILKHKAI